MQYLEPYVPYLFGGCLLLLLMVVLIVGVVLVATFVRRTPSKPSAALLYSIPPAERGTGQHHSMLDLVYEHLASEKIARRRRQVSDKLYDFFQDAPAPKA